MFTSSRPAWDAWQSLRAEMPRPTTPADILLIPTERIESFMRCAGMDVGSDRSFRFYRLVKACDVAWRDAMTPAEDDEDGDA